MVSPGSTLAVPVFLIVSVAHLLASRASPAATLRPGKSHMRSGGFGGAWRGMLNAGMTSPMCLPWPLVLPDFALMIALLLTVSIT